MLEPLCKMHLQFNMRKNGRNGNNNFEHNCILFFLHANMFSFHFIMEALEKSTTGKSIEKSDVTGNM